MISIYIYIEKGQTVVKGVVSGLTLWIRLKPNMCCRIQSLGMI